MSLLVLNETFFLFIHMGACWTKYMICSMIEPFTLFFLLLKNEISQ